MGVDEVADELYGLVPGEFTATRNARAKELAGAGSKAEAGEVRKLAKPSQSAWLANLLVREHPDEVDELIGLRSAVTAAHPTDARARNRVLADRRRTLVADLVTAAGALSRRAGHAMTAAAQRELETTLEAVVADDAAARTLRRGQVTVALTHVGFGDLDLSSAPSPAEPPSGRSLSGRSTAKRARDHDRAVNRRNAAQAIVEAAEATVLEARARRDAARRQRRESADQLQRAERELDRTDVALARAEEARRRAQERLRDAPAP